MTCTISNQKQEFVNQDRCTVINKEECCLEGRSFVKITYEHRLSLGQRFIRGLFVVLMALLLVPFFVQKTWMKALWKQALTGLEQKIVHIAKEKSLIPDDQRARFPFPPFILTIKCSSQEIYEELQALLSEWEYSFSVEPDTRIIKLSRAQEELEMVGHYLKGRGDQCIKGHWSGLKIDSANVEIDDQDPFLKEIENFWKERSFPAFIHSQKATTLLEAVDHTLQMHQGLIVGECHRDESPKRFLIENMKDLKNRGVTTLFLEHLLYDTMQNELDLFYQSKVCPRSLKSYLTYLDAVSRTSQCPYNYTNLVTQAVQEGIRPVAIDTAYAHQFGLDQATRTYTVDIRLRCMNYTAHKIIAHEKADGKFICLVGLGHAITWKGVSGLADLLRVPNIMINDAPEEEPVNSSITPVSSSLITELNFPPEAVHYYARPYKRTSSVRAFD